MWSLSLNPLLPTQTQSTTKQQNMEKGIWWFSSQKAYNADFDDLFVVRVNMLFAKQLSF